MHTPTIEYGLIAPLIVLIVGAIVSVLAEAFIKRGKRFSVQFAIAVITMAVALGLVCFDWSSQPGAAVMGALSIDGPTRVVWMLLLSFGLLSALLYGERRIGGGASSFAPQGHTVPGSLAERQAIAARQENSEVFALLEMSLFGMLVFSAANDLLTMFVALEILSLPLYVMCALARRRRLLSQEAALKYFMLGAMSSAFFLFGAALLYGYTGSFNFALMDRSITLSTESIGLLLAGTALVTSGVLFKVGAVPFHNWVPDVYTGAPTPVTGFMAICTKIAAFAGLLRVLYVALGGARWDWQLVLVVIALATMLIGAVVGLAQTDVKRLLAYSSIAHAGFIMIAVVGAVTAAGGLAAGESGSVSSVMYYLAAYGLATLGAFAILPMVRRVGGEANGFDAWAGLGRRRPVLAVIMTLFLASMAGIPLTGGFIGKLLAFSAGWQGGYAWLAVVAICLSVVTAAYYFRVVWIMFFKEPDMEVDVVKAGWPTWLVIIIGVVGTVVLGIAPGPVLDLFTGAAQFLR
ncbi:NADH-quinone oxidoreductase subunit NuoN [Propionibacterium freudenreichii]|uniref:NADH-quinone oxidoreductase subunit NuoN n=1 Tax=Propionibacterium freudenreichii TaxID=1744 RepID=UPI003852012B